MRTLTAFLGLLIFVANARSAYADDACPSSAGAGEYDCAVAKEYETEKIALGAALFAAGEGIGIARAFYTKAGTNAWWAVPIGGPLVAMATTKYKGDFAGVAVLGDFLIGGTALGLQILGAAIAIDGIANPKEKSVSNTTLSISPMVSATQRGAVIEGTF